MTLIGVLVLVHLLVLVPHPGYELDVEGDINFSGDLYQDGQLFTSGLGVGIGTINNSGIITGRVGIGFTDMNFYWNWDHSYWLWIHSCC